MVKTILDQSHLAPFPLQVAPTYWSFDHTLRIYPLPTVLVMCDTTGWGSFAITYEGCCVINIGRLFRVDHGDGRGRYTVAWWEWNCGKREANEVTVGITEREDEAGKEKKERKRKAMEKDQIKQGRNTSSIPPGGAGFGEIQAEESPREDALIEREGKEQGEEMVIDA